MIQYDVIDKVDIPPPPSIAAQDRGEWKAIARHMKILPPKKVVRILVEDRYISTMRSSLHTAARIVGVKVSTMHSGKYLYAVKTGTAQPLEKLRIQFKCAGCGDTFTAKRPGQKYCNDIECQRKRRTGNRRAYERRERDKKEKAA